MFNFSKKQDITEKIVTEKINEMIAKTVKTVLDTSLKDADNCLKLQKDINALSDEKRKLKDELAEIKKEKELEKTEIEHLVALKEERMNLKVSQKEIELEKRFQEKEMGLMKNNYEMMVVNIKEAHSDIKVIYQQIMERLPNVNLNIKKTGKA